MKCCFLLLYSYTSDGDPLDPTLQRVIDADDIRQPPSNLTSPMQLCAIDYPMHAYTLDPDHLARKWSMGSHLLVVSGSDHLPTKHSSS